MSKVSGRAQPAGAQDRAQHRARLEAMSLRQPNVESAGAPPLLARLFTVYEELEALVPCTGSGYPLGTTGDFDSIQHLHEEVAEIAGAVEELTRRLDAGALRRIYDQVVRINARWSTLREEIDWTRVLNVEDGPRRLAAWKGNVSARLDRVMVGLRELVVAVATGAPLDGPASP